VIPESFGDLLRTLMSTQAKRLMFCLNQYYVPFTNNPSIGISEFGVHGIIVCSVAVQTFFRDVYGIPDLPLIPIAIDTKRFSTSKRKRRQIAFMPRKLAEDGYFIANTFRRRHKHYADVPWVPINNVVQHRAAEIMSESAVFLSLSHKESIGLPPLEAMSCGCLVSGYHGDGGREYMTPKNGWWAETGDWLAVNRRLAGRCGRPRCRS
jgi:glycosyltransferase involved in cell wall biosynthesis